MKKLSRRSVIPLLGASMLAPFMIQSSPVKPEIHTNYQLPKALAKGDLVGICAPAGASHDQKEVADFVLLLQNLGYRVKTAGNLQTRFGYLSDTDEARSKAFMELILDTEVKAIFFTRGGWGCARILPLLDFNAIQKNPKIILGFSDITAFLVAITHKTGLITFHGPNGNASWGDFSLKSIENMIVKGTTETIVTTDPKLYPTPPVCIRPGSARGELYGGNLSVLTGLLGTEYLPDWKGKILFLEEVKEEPYRVDRMLTQWKLNGVFDQLAGVVLGQFRKCIPEEPEWSFSLEQVFEQHFKDAKFPVFSGFLCGHILDKFTLPVGQTVEMDATQFSIRPLASSVRFL